MIILEMRQPIYLAPKGPRRVAVGVSPRISGHPCSPSRAAAAASGVGRGAVAAARLFDSFCTPTVGLRPRLHAVAAARLAIREGCMPGRAIPYRTGAEVHHG